METIDDDTDKHGIQFVKSKDSKLASELGIFSFPALVYYETGVPIMYDGKFEFFTFWFFFLIKFYTGIQMVIYFIVNPRIEQVCL